MIGAKHLGRRRLPTVLFSPGGPARSPALTFTSSPDVAAGDRQFFVDDPLRPVQLRPVLASEGLLERPLRGGEWVLVARFTSKPQVRAYVRLPVHLRKNDDAGVQEAIRLVERVSPKIAAMFRAALTAPPPPPPPEGRT